MKMLKYPDFRKVLNDYKLGLTEGEIKAVFDGFDVSRMGTIDYEEFLKIVRVPFPGGYIDTKLIGKNERVSYRSSAESF